MANTTVRSGENAKTITITGLDANWDCKVDLPVDSMRLDHVTFIPSAANDRCIIPEIGFDTGIVSGTDARTIYLYGKRYSPSFAIATWTLGTAANAKLIIEEY